VDEYIATHPEDVQAVLRRVRNTIRKALPGAEEVISYQIPTYKLHGAPALYFAGWRQHYSLYPATARVIEAFKDDLARYEINHATIRGELPTATPGFRRSSSRESSMSSKGRRVCRRATP
jgi:uncharacterized protein YdhG (YjbR/CyaY superfamily)